MAYVIPLVVTLVLSVTGTLLALWLALRHAQLDVPDRRRLHAAPTPRGGGLGPIVAWLPIVAGVLYPGDIFAHPSAVASAMALIIVACIGALDDRHDLSIRPRLAAHVVAATLVAWSFLGGVDSTSAAFALLVLAIGGVASINLHNFMDGANGFLSFQAIFVFAMLAGLAGLRGDLAFAAAAILLASSVLVFLPFNFPNARIFLGDIGSGSIGLMIGIMSLVAVDHGLLGWGSVLILTSAFMVDAGGTLLLRMRKTTQWHQGHRTHLYQWLWRRRFGAAAINAIYQAWNLCVVLPALLIMERNANSLWWEFAAAIAVYGLGIFLWSTARRALWRTHRAQYRP